MRIVALALVLLGLIAAPARAAGSTTGATLLNDVAVNYQQAVIAHDATLAPRLRTECRLLNVAQPSPALAKLSRTLDATRDQFHPWPLASEVAAQASAAGAGGAA